MDPSHGAFVAASATDQLKLLPRTASQNDYPTSNSSGQNRSSADLFAMIAVTIFLFGEER
jgi:hypothetical protein